MYLNINMLKIGLWDLKCKKICEIAQLVMVDKVEVSFYIIETWFKIVNIRIRKNILIKKNLRSTSLITKIIHYCSQWLITVWYVQLLLPYLMYWYTNIASNILLLEKWVSKQFFQLSSTRRYDDNILNKYKYNV